jgi:hypothetical protein
MRFPISYVLPIRVESTADGELTNYLEWLATLVELIVVDGSPEPVFNAHGRLWASSDAVHVRPDADLLHLVNGKVAGVLSGIRRATCSSVIVADDDVRYDVESLRTMGAALERADVVRPQNYFEPLPWHARLDTARSLLNRMSGGDWPGTLGVRKAALVATGGYDGDVMFENLELVRTVTAAGGLADCPLDLYVRRLPPSTRHFWSQRVRQAYDEVARPARLAVWLSVLPAATFLASTGRARWVAAAAVSTIAAAEAGRRRAGGRRVFPVSAALLAPLWIVERAISVWLAVGAFVFLGGIPYRGRIVARAATPVRQLRRRLKASDATGTGALADRRLVAAADGRRYPRTASADARRRLRA